MPDVGFAFVHPSEIACALVFVLSKKANPNACAFFRRAFLSFVLETVAM
jgi:hypothetical protein